MPYVPIGIKETKKKKKNEIMELVNKLNYKLPHEVLKTIKLNILESPIIVIIISAFKFKVQTFICHRKITFL